MNSAAEAQRFERLRLQGVQRHADGSIDVDEPGGKANLTDVAAAIGLGQLPHLDAFNARRKVLAGRYFARLDRGLGLELPIEEYERGNWHMFQPLLPLGRLAFGRQAFIEAMKQHGIGIGVHYPAMHLFALYRRLGYRPGDFPVAEKIGAATVTLPLFAAMADADVDRVCTALQRVIEPALQR